MKNFLTLVFIAFTNYLPAQSFEFDLSRIQKDEKLPQKEAQWIADNLSKDEITELFSLVTELSKPAAAQLLAGHLYLDGEYTRPWSKTYLDSLNMRPQDGEAGFIRVAYLVANFRKEVIEYWEESPIYAAKFIDQELQIPDVDDNLINGDITFSFDFSPCKTLINILSQDDISYSEIVLMLDNVYWTELIQHRSQSFYSRPSNTERIALCLEKAASTKPLDKLYRYMNPYGLLNFTDVKTNIDSYEQQINILSANEKVIADFINSRVSPLLPVKTQFKREVSFFFMNGADGWATEIVTAIDLNYFKSDYEKLLNLLVHESYHSGQNVFKHDETQTKDSNDWFTMTLDYIFNEGTATYIAPPKRISQAEYEDEVKRGVSLLEEIFIESTKPEPNEDTLDKLVNEGVSGAGPFYWLGAEMTKVIVEELGNKELAKTIPKDGKAFTKAYNRSTQNSKKNKNLFSNALMNYLTMM